MVQTSLPLEGDAVEMLRESPESGFPPARQLESFGGLSSLAHSTLLQLVLALGAFVAAGHLEWSGHVARQRWVSGTPTRTVTVEDTVERIDGPSTKFFSRLKVVDHTGEEVRLWARTPTPGLTPEVRKTKSGYLASWQVPPWGAGAIPALTGLALMAFGWSAARRDLATRRQCLELSRSGHLVAFSGVYSTSVKNPLTVTESCSIDYAGATHVQDFDYFSGGPLRLAKDQGTVVALARRDGALHVLRSDGFPLSEVPPGIACSAPKTLEQQVARRWLYLAGISLACGALLVGLWFKLNSASPSIPSALLSTTGKARDVSSTPSSLDFRIGTHWFRFFLEGRDDPAAIEIAAGDEVAVSYAADDVTTNTILGRTYFKPSQVKVDGNLIKSHEDILKGDRSNVQAGLTFAELAAPLLLWLGLGIGASVLPRSGL